MFSEEYVVLVCTKLATTMCVAMWFLSCSEFVLAHCCVLARVVVQIFKIFMFMVFLFFDLVENPK